MADELEEFLGEERRTAKLGRTPFMGEFRRRFNFAPVPYASRQRDEFTKRVRADLSEVKFFFTGWVAVEFTLYLDQQTRFETPEQADLDNYAKLLCDAIKGPHGVIIDDSQIQTLTVTWMDTYDEPRIGCEVRGLDPDHFTPKPVILYEMPDGLFYPQGPLIQDESLQDQEEALRFLLPYLHKMIRTKVNVRHRLRQDGQSRLKAFQHSKYFGPAFEGFHKSRVADTGFPLRSLGEWTRDFPVGD
jgi:Holliday junction resolvase RusA-like endonuclease